MAPISCDRLTYVEDHGINMEEVFMKAGAAGRIGKGKDEELSKNYTSKKIMDALQCKRKELFLQVISFH